MTRPHDTPAMTVYTVIMSAAKRKSKDRPGWGTQTQEMRHRKMVSLTLSDGARDKLARLAYEWRLSKSAVVDRLITEEPEPKS